MTEDQKRKAHVIAVAKYNREKTKSKLLTFNIKTDADILSHLDSVGNVTGYIKNLIRKDLKK